MKILLACAVLGVSILHALYCVLSTTTTSVYVVESRVSIKELALGLTEPQRLASVGWNRLGCNTLTNRLFARTFY